MNRFVAVIALLGSASAFPVPEDAPVAPALAPVGPPAGPGGDLAVGVSPVDQV